MLRKGLRKKCSLVLIPFIEAMAPEQYTMNNLDYYRSTCSTQSTDSKVTFTDVPRVMFDQMSGYPVAKSS
jgi:hypothetical protein